MKKNFNLLSFIALALVLAQINSDTVNPYTGTGTDTNPICDAPGKLDLTATNIKTEQGFPIPFDYASTYFDPNGDAAPLLIKSGDSNFPWQIFSYFDATIQQGKFVDCTGTTGGTYIAHFNQVLFVKVGTAYKACKFIPSGDNPSTLVYTLKAPTNGITSFTNFMPFYYNKIADSVYVGISDGTQSAVYIYYVGSITGGDSVASMNGHKYSHGLTSIQGNPMIVYSHAQNSLFVVPSLTMESNTWTSFAITIPSNSIVNIHNLQFGQSILAFVDSATQFTGKLYKFNVNRDNRELSYTDTTTTPFKDFSDGCSNFVRVGTTSMYWIHQKSDYTTFLESIYSIAELTRYDYGTVINEVALSGNKAVLFTDTTILYLKHESNGGIKKVLSAPASKVTLSGEYMYILQVSCMCKAIKRFACFSSTLNCIIVKKGRDNCSKTDTFYTAPPPSEDY